MSQQQDSKYFAFISYSSKDTKWGKRLHKKLEYYRMPSKLCSERGWKRKPLSPIFFAPYDIQPAGLSDELQKQLSLSKNLIVIGSPNSAQSEWVGKEIEFFHSLGRTENIHYFIIDGNPSSSDPQTGCYHPILKELGIPEILGANIHEKVYQWPWMNKERAYVQLVSKLLGVDFDTIWQRHKRLLVQKTIAWTIGILVVLAAFLDVWMYSQPVDVTVRLNEASTHNDSLPPIRDAVVTMTFDNETKTDTIHSLDKTAVFPNIPHRFINNSVQVDVTCRGVQTFNEVILLSKDITLDIRRDDSYYGDIRFKIWNFRKEQTVSGVSISIEGCQGVSDDDGQVRILIPLAKQKRAYRVESSIPLERDSIVPPCGPDDVIIVK